MNDLLAVLPRVPVSPELALLLSAMIVSAGISLFLLIRNRSSLSAPVEGGADFGAIFESPSSLLPHLLELRQRLIASLVAVLVATLASAVVTPSALVALAEPIGGLDKLQIIEVTESVHVYFRVSLTLGMLLASPVVIAELWIFIAAGLKPSERRWFYWLFPFALLLFLSGVAFAYFVTLPVAVPFLTGFLGIQTLPRLQNYVEFVTSVLLWVGLSFELPLVVFLLAKAKLVTAGDLLRGWRFAIVGIAILAAVVTPTPDPVNMSIVAAPLIALYMLSVVLALFAR